MWIMWTGGFVSVVEKASDRGNGTLTVRARDARSLDNFAQAAGYAAQTYKMDMATDYPFRDVFTREEVGTALVEIIRTLDYSNFKNAAKALRGEVFAKALGNVWWDMQSLTTKKVKRAMDKAWATALPKASRWGDKGAWNNDVLEPEDNELDEIEHKEVESMTDAEWKVYLKESWGIDEDDEVAIPEVR